MGKLFRNRRLVLIVIAVILLVAVPVSAAVAVASWMGSKVLVSLPTPELTITKLVFTEGKATEGKIVINVDNRDISAITVNTIKVNSVTQDAWSAGNSTTIPAGGTDNITIICAVVAGHKYQVYLFAPDGLLVGAYTDTA